MARKISLTAVFVLFMLFLLIANAVEDSNANIQYEERIIEESISANETITIKEEVQEYTSSEDNQTSKPATASFGVYLQIVG